MPRKKKTEEVKEVIEKVTAVKEPKPVNYGSGWNRVNNMLNAGFTIEQIRGGNENGSF